MMTCETGAVTFFLRCEDSDKPFGGASIALF